MPPPPYSCAVFCMLLNDIIHFFFPHSISSDSDDEDKKIAIPTPLLSHTSPATESTLEEQFAHVCSQTKYLMPEKSSEEEEENGDDYKVVTITPTENLPGNDGGDAVASGGVEITSVVESKKMKRSKHAVKYAELTPQLCPMPNPHHQQLLSRMKPKKKMGEFHYVPLLLLAWMTSITTHLDIPEYLGLSRDVS